MKQTYLVRVFHFALSVLLIACAVLAQEAVSQQRELEKISGIVRGRCVDGLTGEPLEGCAVEVRAWGGRRDDLPPMLIRPGAAITGVDGRFEVRVVAREDFQVRLEAVLDGRWPRTGRWRCIVPGEVEEVGDVRLYPGVHAVGKAVDAAGEPVPGVSIGIEGLPLQLAGHPAANGVRWCVSGEHGGFTSRAALPAGEFGLRIGTEGISLVAPSRITIPDAGPMAPLTIVVKQEPFIAGICVDENGVPLAGVELEAALENHSGRLPTARVGEDGTFRMYRAEGCPDPVRLEVGDPGPCERPGRPTAELRWGDHDVRIQLQRALTLEVEVVVAGSGDPVEEFAVRIYPTGRVSVHSRDRRIRASGRHEAGKLVLHGVPRGADRIEIIPRDPSLACRHLDIVATETMVLRRIELTRMVPMMVLVLDAQGVPAPNALVQVIEPGNRNRPGLLDPRRDGSNPVSSDPAVHFDELLHRATTDQGGHCIVYGLSGREDLALTVRLGDGSEQRTDDVAFGPRHGFRQLSFEQR